MALLAPDARQRSRVKRIVERAGGRVVVDAPADPSCLGLLEHAASEVMILEPGPPGRATGELTPAMLSPRCPVVLLTQETDADRLDLAQETGVMACLVQPFPPAQLPPTLDLAIARFRDVEELRQALEDRKFIERAKGRLMARYRLTEEEAFVSLRRRAMDTRSRLGDVARLLLESDTAVAAK